MGPQFHQTGYGKKFFEHQLPVLTRAIEKLSDNIEKQNERIEKGYEVTICEETVYEDGDELLVETGKGTLVAEVTSDSDYPGIRILLVDENDVEHTVALVEYTNEKDLRTLCYTNTNEDYISVTRWDQKGKGE